jgi:hypothetical protein
MLQFLRGIALIAAMIMNFGSALAEADMYSANFMIAGCRLLLQPDLPNTSKEAFYIGQCTGVIEGLIYAASGVVCLPVGATQGQAIHVVVKYIDDRPARLHENFKPLALEALQAAWPCKK